MKTLKVYATENDSFSIQCPECHKVSVVPKHKIKKYELVVHCICKGTFLLQVENRKKRRKSSEIVGYFGKQGRIKDSKEWEKSIKNKSKINCIIKNLSNNGIGIQVYAMQNLQIGDVIYVAFNLGDAANSEIEKTAVIRHIEGNYLGCEFLEESKNDKRIGFFLLT